jgi:glycosyltransferase involved in cell wall biosynthesis
VNGLPIVAIFGAEDILLYSDTEAPEVETRAFDCRCFVDDSELERILIEERPHVIVTFGDMYGFQRLLAAPFEVRRRWLHFPDTSDLDHAGRAVWLCYLSVCLDQRKEEPLVSVFTPTYRTGLRFLRPLMSMRAQTYRNWEWIIWDDSDDGGETAAMIGGLVKSDHRVELVRPGRHSGVIGEVKHKACALSCGTILVELDHDDELTSDALAMVVDAWRKHPEGGFFYSDFVEVDPNLNSLRYPDGWGFGLGSYRKERLNGREFDVVNTPGISPKTIRHIVAAPNHFRAWRRDLYFQIGGHNREIHVADDYEIMVRTFLATRMVHIPRLGYVQYMDGGTNTQRIRNKDIQRHVRYLQSRYDRQIHERFLALGVDDYVWDEESGCADFRYANPENVQVASLTYEE